MDAVQAIFICGWFHTVYARVQTADHHLRIRSKMATLDNHLSTTGNTAGIGHHSLNRWQFRIRHRTGGERKYMVPGQRMAGQRRQTRLDHHGVLGGNIQYSIRPARHLNITTCRRVGLFVHPSIVDVKIRRDIFTQHIASATGIRNDSATVNIDIISRQSAGRQDRRQFDLDKRKFCRYLRFVRHRTGGHHCQFCEFQPVDTLAASRDLDRTTSQRQIPQRKIILTGLTMDNGRNGGIERGVFQLFQIDDFHYRLGRTVLFIRIMHGCVSMVTRDLDVVDAIGHAITTGGLELDGA